MDVLDPKVYIDTLTKHYQAHFSSAGIAKTLKLGPIPQLHKDFFVLEVPPNNRHDMFCYCTVGMSIDRLDDNLIELVLYSPKSDDFLVELLTIIADFHRNGAALNLNHTINIGRPWLDNSNCDHGLISLPYLDGEGLEILNIGPKEIHCYWLIPITQQEKEYKREHGIDALEELFEERQMNYLDINRESLV